MHEPPFELEQHVAALHQPPPEHAVQFYKRDCFPAEAVADYFGAGFACSESALIIAAENHTRFIKDFAEAASLDTDALRRRGLLTCLDANEIVAQLRNKGPLTEISVDETLSPVLSRLTAASPSGRIRVFGELVNLLACEGDYLSCIELERQWRRLLTVYSFKLYCAYSVESFAHDSSAEFVSEVCDLHNEIFAEDCSSPCAGPFAKLLERQLALQLETRFRKASELALHSLEDEYLQLYEAHVQHLRDCIEQGIRNTPPIFTERLKLCTDLDMMVQRSLEEILVAAARTISERRLAPQGSPQWQKLTGEILAQAKLTHIFHNLQQFVRSQQLH